MVAPSSKTILWVGMWLSWLSVGFSMLLMQIWLPAVAIFFNSHSQLSVQTLTILVWSPCAIAGINIFVHDKKNQALVAIPLFEHMKT